MTDSEAREMARDLVRGSIIEDAAAQFIAQVLKEAHDSRIKPLRAERDALSEKLALAVKALKGCMVGGNHLALHLPEPNPAPETNPMDALERIGSGVAYDVWCAWRSLMLARATLAALEEKKDD